MYQLIDSFIESAKEKFLQALKNELNMDDFEVLVEIDRSNWMVIFEIRLKEH